MPPLRVEIVGLYSILIQLYNIVGPYLYSDLFYPRILCPLALG